MRAIAFTERVLQFFRRFKHDELKCSIGRVIVGLVALSTKGVVHIELEVRIDVVLSRGIAEWPIRWYRKE